MRHFWVLISAVCLSVLLTGCFGPTEQEQLVMDTVMAQVEPLTGGSMVQINAVFFPGVSAEDLPGEGILAPLMANSTITVKSADKNTVLLEVTAPDMSGIFTDHLSVLLKASGPVEMAELILAYAEQSETVSTEVTLPYTMVGDTVIVDYDDPSLLDALTGGLMGAYQELYAQFYEGLEGTIG